MGSTCSYMGSCVYGEDTCTQFSTLTSKHPLWDTKVKHRPIGGALQEKTITEWLVKFVNDANTKKPDFDFVVWGRNSGRRYEDFLG